MCIVCVIVSCTCGSVSRAREFIVCVCVRCAFVYGVRVYSYVRVHIAYECVHKCVQLPLVPFAIILCSY